MKKKSGSRIYHHSCEGEEVLLLSFASGETASVMPRTPKCEEKEYKRRTASEDHAK